MIKNKIALFVPKLHGGGAERVVSRLSYALSEYYEVIVLIYNDDVISYECSSELINLAKGNKLFPIRVLMAAHNINKVIRRYDIRVVISLLDVPNLINGLLVRNAVKIVSIRAYYEKSMAYGIVALLKYYVLKLACQKSDLILTLSERQNRVLYEEMQIPYNKMSRVDNLFNTNDIRGFCKGKVPKRIEAFINEKTTVAVGRLQEQKNYTELLKLFKILHDSDSDMRLLILGEGELKEELILLCQELEIDDNVMFAGRLTNPFPCIARARAYISLSNYEGFPNAMVEAMICGLPVMHSDCLTGPSEILSNGEIKCTTEAKECEYGILLPMIMEGEKGIIKNIKSTSVIDVWKKVINDEYYNEKLRMKAKKCAMKYDEKVVIKQYVDIIDKYLQ